MIDKKIISRVEGILHGFPLTRDNDQMLVAKFWAQELQDDLYIPAIELLKRLEKHELTHFESIRRCRQKLQQENPDLRGVKYKARQSHQETVKEEIRDFTNFCGGQEDFLDFGGGE